MLVALLRLLEVDLVEGDFSELLGLASLGDPALKFLLSLAPFGFKINCLRMFWSIIIYDFLV